MKTQNITICGKEVALAYCYATEIAFKVLADEDINAFVEEAVTTLNDNRVPDIKKSLLFILASATSYYERHDSENCPISVEDMMHDATPDEVWAAVGTVLALRAQFFHAPAGELEKKEDDPKNA